MKKVMQGVYRGLKYLQAEGHFAVEGALILDLRPL